MGNNHEAHPTFLHSFRLGDMVVLAGGYGKNIFEGRFKVAATTSKSVTLKVMEKDDAEQKAT